MVVPGDGSVAAGHHAAVDVPDGTGDPAGGRGRSEEHTSELQSQSNLVCRLLLEKKNIRYVTRLCSRQALRSPAPRRFPPDPPPTTYPQPHTPTLLHPLHHELLHDQAT